MRLILLAVCNRFSSCAGADARRPSGSRPGPLPRTVRPGVLG